MKNRLWTVVVIMVGAITVIPLITIAGVSIIGLTAKHTSQNLTLNYIQGGMASESEITLDGVRCTSKDNGGFSAADITRTGRASFDARTLSGGSFGIGATLPDGRRFLSSSSFSIKDGEVVFTDRTRGYLTAPDGTTIDARATLSGTLHCDQQTTLR